MKYEKRSENALDSNIWPVYRARARTYLVNKLYEQRLVNSPCSIKQALQLLSLLRLSTYLDSTKKWISGCSLVWKVAHIAIGHYVNQRLLRSLHEWLGQVAYGRHILANPTFRLDRLVFSFDFQSATDRWPLLVLFRMLTYLFCLSCSSFSTGVQDLSSTG